MGAWRAGGVAIALVAGCNGLFGVDELGFDQATTSVSASSSSGVGGAASVSSSSSSVSSSSAGGAGGGGGAEPFCGDGIVNLIEQCDDANDDPDDGCHNCLVSCLGEGETLIPSTLHCYLFSEDVPQAETVNWADARTACMAWGGDLIAVTSDTEQLLVDGLVTERTWMGGTDAAREGTWVWVNGEPWGFENWGATQPDNDTSGGPGGAPGFPEHCGEFFASGSWNDASCTTQNPYICERPPPEAGR